MLKGTLKEIGLTENESNVYLALLELGESTSGKIIEKANIRTGRIYDILNSLKDKGMISEIQKDKIKRFSCAEPKRILDMLDKKKDTLEQQKNDIKNYIPEILNKINNSKSKTKIEIFTGFEGMKTAMLKETSHYKKGSEVFTIGIQNPEFYNKRTMDFFKYNIYNVRNRLNIKVRKINDESARKNIVQEEKTKNIITKYLPYPSVTTFNITENLVIIGLYGSEEIYITIEDEEVSKNFKTQFEFLWKIAKK